ncbi:hypothetical protein [uncultured Aureimonas sp.]|uniref:hypothetical protein n=1 Tax=uncultured Aureimonas sp. TaxID=1604662 RepID=UPI0025D1D58C|nr:hypothetical protein [uncultured Aureimonas sp.]
MPDEPEGEFLFHRPYISPSARRLFKRATTSRHERHRFRIMPRTLRSVPALERGLRLRVAAVPFALWGIAALASLRLSPEFRQLLLTLVTYYLAPMMLYGIWTVAFRRRPLKVSRYPWTFGIDGLVLACKTALIAFAACPFILSLFDHLFGEGREPGRSILGVSTFDITFLMFLSVAPMTIGAGVGSWVLYNIIGTGHRRRLYEALTQARAAR